MTMKPEDFARPVGEEEAEAACEAYADRDPRAGQGIAEHRISVTLVATTQPDKCWRGAFTLPEVASIIREKTPAHNGVLLTGLALLCYIGTLTLATAARREVGGTRLAPVRATVPAARPADRTHYPAAWPDSPGETTGSWFIRD